MVKTSRLKPLSAKSAKEKREYIKMCMTMDAQIMEEEGYIACASCGITLVNPSGVAIRPWGHSHNLPVGQFKDFELLHRNVAPRCSDWGGREGCHDKLDSGNITKIMSLDDFQALMEYRFEVCEEGYNLWVNKMIEAGITDYSIHINEDPDQ